MRTGVAWQQMSPGVEEARGVSGFAGWVRP